MYLSFQGKVFIAPIGASGLPDTYYDVGNIKDFKTSSDITKIEHNETSTGQRLPDFVLVTQTKGSVNLTLEDFKQENMALAFRSVATADAGGAVVNEVINLSAPAAGQRFMLAKQNVSALVVKDSAGTPATIAPANYLLEDAAFGLVALASAFAIGTLVLPLKASYTAGATTQIPMFTGASRNYSIKLIGVNTADGNKKVMIEYYNVFLPPAKDLNWITNDLTSLPLEGTALIDPTKPSGGGLGQFGRVVYL
jgi:hypothetical protein